MENTHVVLGTLYWLWITNDSMNQISDLLQDATEISPCSFRLSHEIADNWLRTTDLTLLRCFASLLPGKIYIEVAFILALPQITQNHARNGEI